MAFHPNRLQQQMALQQHFSDTDNNFVLRTILPDHYHLAVDNNGGGELGESEDGGGDVNWQNARYKAGVLSHLLYEQLLSAHVACLRIVTPVDQLPRIDAQLAQSQHVVLKYSGFEGQSNFGDDKELDQFMVCFFSS
ncbi:unnamed protein product [Lactuca virosa]|uniref:KNOX1 domain-containing protein n=1 Tax=Lactuca virosa TaxID=75947 RepID=A0AAU9PFK2_9ASTR|nr:unnamed protein product [Lactuca virosa]